MTDPTENPELVNRAEAFLSDYYHEELLEMADTGSALKVDWFDVYSFDPDLARDLVEKPEHMFPHFKEAIQQYDAIGHVDIGTPEIHLVDLGEDRLFNPSELRHEHGNSYVAIEGELARITPPTDRPEMVSFVCKRCGTISEVSQPVFELQEPFECEGCGRNGPFEIDEEKTEWTDHSKLRIKTPPDESGELGQSHIDGYVGGDLVDQGHEDYGLLARAGEKCTVYGVVERVQKGGRNENESLFDRILNVKAIEFEENGKELNIEEHREEFEELAKRGDAVDIFAQSIAPELYATPEWEWALELLVAYLFATPRIDIDNGPTYRGDIHALIIADYGLGKSTVNRAVARYSPKSVKESVTGMSSEVGLLAASVKDDFGEGQWTLKPGVLVRGNGGHVILDEIDKTDADLERMNDALEGDQKVDIDKAGQSVTYKSRVGLLATGNPKDDNFTHGESIAKQLDIGGSLLSRFDGIITMKDTPDSDVDSEVAERVGTSYQEAQEYAYGDREEFDILDRVVEVDVGRNWIAYARENVYPSISDAQIEDIRDWYADEIRPLNKHYNNPESGEEDPPVPVTPRAIEDTIRLSVAFARVNLRGAVHVDDLERAKTLKKKLVGQTFRDGQAQPHHLQKSFSQHERQERMMNLLEKHGPMGENEYVSKCIDKGMSGSKVKKDMAKKKRQGEIMEPENGVVKKT